MEEGYPCWTYVKTMFCRNFICHLRKSRQHIKIYILTYSNSARNGNQALGMNHTFGKTWDNIILTKLKEINNILVLGTAER